MLLGWKLGLEAVNCKALKNTRMVLACTVLRSAYQHPLLVSLLCSMSSKNENARVSVVVSAKSFTAYETAFHTESEMLPQADFIDMDSMVITTGGKQNIAACFLIHLPNQPPHSPTVLLHC